MSFNKCKAWLIEKHILGVKEGNEWVSECVNEYIQLSSDLILKGRTYEKRTFRMLVHIHVGIPSACQPTNSKIRPPCQFSFFLPFSQSMCFNKPFRLVSSFYVTRAHQNNTTPSTEYLHPQPEKLFYEGCAIFLLQELDLLALCWRKLSMGTTLLSAAFGSTCPYIDP